MDSSVLGSGAASGWGLVCALREELGELRRFEVAQHMRLGLEVYELKIASQRVLAAVAGVGKVQAARAATVLLGMQPGGATRGMLVVGTCGGMTRGLTPGSLVHCGVAIQTDFARREGRSVESDAALQAAWRRVAPGSVASFLTADRPVLSLWRRLRLAKTFQGPCVADMETAAVAAVSSAAGVPWAALRAVTDKADNLGALAFKLHFPSQAGRAADTLPGLLEMISRT